MAHTLAPITHYTVAHVSGDGSAARSEFTDRDKAWAFMRHCDSLGVLAGYPQAQYGAAS